MPLEFNSINNLASSLGRNRFQRLGKYVATLTRFSTGMRTAVQANGFTSRGFNDLLSVRVENVKIPDQNMFTSEISGPGGFDYDHPYQYSLVKDVTMTVLNDQFDRLRNCFVDWLRVSSGIVSNGALTYRSQTSCDFSVIALNDNGVPTSGYSIEDVIIKQVDGTDFDTSSNELVKFNLILSCRRLRRLSGVESNIALSGLVF